jgi:hypothetical protein
MVGVIRKAIFTMMANSVVYEGFFDAKQRADFLDFQSMVMV